MEVKQLYTQSAAVFTNLIKEESYHQFEARAMLLGEKGAGKTTVARFLVRKGPTKVRISTEGIDLYTALAFIDRETDEWLNGKQGK
jgi:polynucleotide 5'-kinase involved in rRNA processing